MTTPSRSASRSRSRSNDAARTSPNGTRAIAVSAEGLEDAKQTQTQFPHLLVLSDEGRGLSDAAELIDAKNKGPNNSAVDAPMTILVDRRGTIRRLSPDEVLQAVDTYVHPSPGAKAEG